MAGISGMMVGFSKTAISGASMMAIPTIAGIFGGKSSAGIILPMLITGDFIAVRHYSKHAEWSYIWKLMPWMIGDIFFGLIVGSAINDAQFKSIIATIVLICLAIMVWLEQKNNEIEIPKQWWVAAIFGLAGGFTTMIGNAAGPVMTIYWLSMRLRKYEFIGTGAWLFMLVNLFKVPLQVIFWGSINLTTFTFDLTMIPAIVLGALLAIWAIKKIPEKPFRVAVMGLTAIAALKLFF